MEIVFSTIFALIAPELLIWLPVLMVGGCLVKHSTKYPNEFIGALILVAAMIIAFCYGIGITAGESGVHRWLIAGIAYGIGQGFLLCFSTVFCYDVIHGVLKYAKRKMEAKQEVANETSAQN